MALMKKDWTQTGVASLYKSISENGYRFLYLTARAIAQVLPAAAAAALTQLL